MGRGIAQIAAQAGSEVHLFDVQAGAADAARQAICAQWDKLAEKGRIDATQLAVQKARLTCAESLRSLAGCALVVEAIVEDLRAKQTLFRELESIVGPDCMFGTNTSSISVTAIGAALAHPQRLLDCTFLTRHR